MKPFKVLTRAVVATLLVLLSTLSGTRAANPYAPPSPMHFQGYLEDATGRPYGTGTPENKELIFRIYKHGTSTDSANLLWSERQRVTLDNGSFSVRLGVGVQEGAEPNTDDLAALFVGNETSERYLGITVVGSGTEIAPRLRFLTAPYAHLASQANRLIDPVTGNSFDPFTAGALAATQISSPIQSTTGNPRGLNATDLQIENASGVDRVAGAPYSVIAGGANNRVDPDSQFGVVLGGSGNVLSATGSKTAQYSFVGGGISHLISGQYDVVVGGNDNHIALDSDYGFIGGGLGIRINSAADYVTIAGGHLNTNGASAHYGVISGGDRNTISDNATFATIGGGQRNRAESVCASVLGGIVNTANGNYSTVVGGDGNSTSAEYAAVLGGKDNVASGTYSMIPGGLSCVASGTYSFAAGRRAKATHTGSFVWSDNTDADFGSTGNNQFSVQASGGVRFATTAAGTEGIQLAAGGTTWSTISDRNRKKQFTPVDGEAVLSKLEAVPVTAWRYDWEDDSSVKHIGPVAQDFKQTFYPGRDDKSISTLEMDGVALAAIKGLKARDDRKNKRITELEQENETLKQTLADLLKRVQAIEARNQ